MGVITRMERRRKRDVGVVGSIKSNQIKLSSFCPPPINHSMVIEIDESSCTRGACLWLTSLSLYNGSVGVCRYLQVMMMISQYLNRNTGDVEGLFDLLSAFVSP